MAYALMLPLPLFLVLLFSVLFLIILTNHHKKYKKLNLPPGPKGLPLLGNLFQFDASTLHLYSCRLAKIYGPILSLKFGRRRVVVIHSASLAKEVLKTQDHIFSDRPPLTGQQKLSYNGLNLAFVPYNDYYREMRKLCVVHLLSSKKIQASALIRQEEVSRMIQKISALSSASKVVNLSNLLTVLTSSIICKLAFGKRYEDEDVQKSKFHSLLKELEGMFAAFFFSDHFPLIGGWIDKLSGLSSRLERVFKDMDEFYNQVINDHLDPNRPKSEHEDFVDVLLRLQKERCFSFDLTFDHIKAILMDVIAAGTQTSAITVGWAMTELMKNPTIMRKGQEELRTLIQGKTFISDSDLPKFTYLKATIKETFRFHPTDPLLVAREVSQQCSLKGYDIPSHSLVFVNVWAIGRDPKAWENPEVFMPERFIESSVDFKGKNFELIPFGAGKRICPGMLVGVSNVELTLANLLYSFDWELPDGVKKEDIDTDVVPGLSMHKKNPLCLTAKMFPCAT